jgi:CRISPR-associated protein Csb2
MLALGIHFLMDRVMATHPADRARPEWPPHPDRAFMALVAAHVETGAADDEAAALRWLEALPPPSLSASAARPRAAVTAFVPVNDNSSPIVKNKALTPMGSMPIGRSRQARAFPATIPDDPVVYLVWLEAEVPAAYRKALDGLCAKVTYLGHSASPVRVWLEESPAAITLAPKVGRAGVQLRVPGPGRLNDLRDRYQAGRRPAPALWQGYDAPLAPQLAVPADARSYFDDNLVVLRQVGGRRFPMESSLLLAQALRNTLMSRLGRSPSPEWLSGHESSGAVSGRPHLAIFPLAFTGHEHADGHLLGLGLALPRDLSDTDGIALMSLLEEEPGLPAELRLLLGRVGECDLIRDDQPESELPRALQTSAFVGPSQRWATVTPAVLDRFPRKGSDMESILAMACERIGLPRPSDVILSACALHEGAPHARSFPSLPARAGRPQRWHTHAVLLFSRPVFGPMLIGAGRYHGYGLSWPLPGRQGGGP